MCDCIEASLAGGAPCPAGWVSCFDLARTRQVCTRTRKVGVDAPLDTQGVLEHFDTPHEVELDVVE